MEKLRAVKKNVEYIMKVYPETRNSDLELIARYMFNNHGIVSFGECRMIKTAPSFETITRVRRKIQAEGRYLSDKQIAQGRADLTETYKEFSRE